MNVTAQVEVVPLIPPRPQLSGPKLPVAELEPFRLNRTTADGVEGAVDVSLTKTVQVEPTPTATKAGEQLTTVMVSERPITTIGAEDGSVADAEGWEADASCFDFEIDAEPISGP